MSNASYRQDQRIIDAKPFLSHVREETEVKPKGSESRSRAQLSKTVAAIEDGDVVHVGIAYRNMECEPVYSRRVGRDIATGRAKFAMAQALKLTNRKGRPSRFGTIQTVSKDEFPEFARALGVYLPEKDSETQWDAVVSEVATEEE